MKTTTTVKRISALALILALALSLSVSAFAAPTSSISADKAKEIAYSDAGVSASQVSSVDALVHYRSGNGYFYKLVFRTASAKYVYIINAATGDITHRGGSEFHHSGGSISGNTTRSRSSVVITREEALAIALAQAGVSATSLKKQEVELKTKRTTSYYEVELKTIGGSEYEYEIDAETGSILDSEVEIARGDKNGGSLSISSDQAMAIALSHAGLSASSLKKQEIELESDDGLCYYEIELKTTGGSKYEYEIDASTGKILDYECDK